MGEAFTEAQIDHLLRLSKLVDELWQEWVQDMTGLRSQQRLQALEGGAVGADWGV